MKQILRSPFLTVLLLLMCIGHFLNAQGGKSLLTGGQNSRYIWHEKTHGRDTLVLPPPQAGMAWYVTFPEWKTDCNGDYLYVYKGIESEMTLTGAFSCKAPETIYETEKGLTLVLVSDGNNTGKSITFNLRQVNLPVVLTEQEKETIAQTVYTSKPQPRKSDTGKIMQDTCAHASRSPEIGISGGNDDWILCKGKCKYISGSGRYYDQWKDNFNGTTINSDIWIQSDGKLTQGCSSVDGSNTLWFGGNTPERQAVTKALSVNKLSYVSFYFRFGKDTSRADNGCEEADLPVENVKFQYKEGNNWITIATLDNNGTIPNGPFDDWKFVCIKLPVQIRQNPFRFYQEAHSGEGFDQWAIEDFKIDVSLPVVGRWKLPDGSMTPNDMEYVCPRTDAEYTFMAYDNAGAFLGQQKRTLKIIEETQISGTLTTPKFIYCPEEQPRPIQVVGYNGVVTEWERSYSCDENNWIGAGGQGPTYTPSFLTTTTCFRAKVDASGCVAFTAPIRLTNTLEATGKVYGDKDTICSGDVVTFTARDHEAQVVRWEYSNDNHTFSLLREDTSRTISVPIYELQNFVRAIIRYPSCRDSAAAATQSHYIKFIGKPSDPPKTLAYGECSVPMSKLYILHTRPQEIAHWEIRNNDGTWSKVNGTENQRVLVGDPYLVAGSVYRVKLIPQNRPNKCDPPMEYLEWIGVPEDIMCCCAYAGDTFCAGDIADRRLCVSQNCGRPLRFERAYNPGLLRCDNLDLVWETLPQDNIDPFSGCYFLNEQMRRSFCVRAIIRHPFDPNNVAIGGSALFKVQREVNDRGKLSIEPTPICVNYNNGLVRLREVDPGLKVVRWENKIAGTSEWMPMSPNLRYDYVFNNLNQDQQIRVFLMDSISRCPFYSDTLDVVLHPNGRPGTVLRDTTVCPDNKGVYVTLTDFLGEPMRWERSNSANCTAPWNIVGFKQATYINPNNITNSFCYRGVVRYNDCQEMYTQPVKITLSPFPKTGIIVGGGTVCAGQSGITLMVSDYTGDILRWEKSYDCASFTKAVLIPETKPVYKVPSISQNTCFRAIFTNGSCEKAGPPIEVSIQPNSFPGKLYSRGDVCGGGTTQLDLSETTGQILRWERSTNQTDWTSITNTTRTYMTPALTETTCYRVWVKTPACPAGPTDPVCVNVVSNKNIGTLAPVDPICKGGKLPPIQIKGIDGTVAEWQVSYNCNQFYNVLYNGSPNPNILVNANEWSNTLCIRARVDRTPCGMYYSNVLEVKVLQPAQGVVSDHQTVCLGQNPQKLTLKDTVGSALQWEYSYNEVDWTFIAGSTGLSSYQPTNLTQTTYFRAVMRNSYCSQALARFAKITVIKNDGELGKVTKDQTICEQTSPETLKLEGNTLPVKGWEYSAGCTDTWSALNLQQTEYQPTNLIQTTCYRVHLAHPYCNALFTPPVKVTVIPPYDAGWLTGPEVFCPTNKLLTLKLMRYRGEIQKWQRSENGTDWTDIAHTLDSMAVSYTVGMKYRVVLNNTGECTKQISSVFEFVVGLPIRGGMLSPAQTLCSNALPQKITLSNHFGDVVRWESSTNGTTWTSIGQAGKTTYTPSVLTQNTYFRAVVSKPDCPESYSESVLIRVAVAPRGGTLTGNAIFCSNQPVTPVQLSNYYGNIDRWEISTDSLNWTNLNNSQTSYTPIGNWNQLWIRVKVSLSPCGEDYSNTFKITRRAAPRAGELASSGSICSGQRSAMMLVRNQSGTIVRWESSTNGVIWFPIPNSNQIVYQSQPLTATTYFRVIIGTPDCGTVATNNVKITVVNVSPNQVTGKITGQNTVCDGQNIRLELSGSNGTVRRWEFSDNNWTNIGTIANTTNTLIYPQRTVVTRKYRARLVIPCGETYSPEYAVTSYATPILQARSEMLCGQTRGRIVATANMPNVTFSIDPQVQPSNQTGIFNNLMPGNYLVMATVPSSGCQARSFVTLTINSLPVPSVIAVTYPSHVAAVVRWGGLPGSGYTYLVRYRPSGLVSWTMLPATADTVRLITGLTPNTVYEVEVAALCGTRQSAWSQGEIRSFRTPEVPTGDCRVQPVPPPANLRVTNINVRSVLVSWTPVRNAIGYILAYGSNLQNPNTWTQVVVCVPETSLVINGLSPNTNYAIQIRTNCTNCTTAVNTRDTRSNWSSLVGFKTLSGTKDGAETLQTEDHLPAFQIYPNPTTGRFSIRLSDVSTDNNEPQAYHLAVTDLNGKIIFYREAILTEENEYPVELPEVAEGIYLLHIRNNERTQTVKLMVR